MVAEVFKPIDHQREHLGWGTVTRLLSHAQLRDILWPHRLTIGLKCGLLDREQTEPVAQMPERRVVCDRGDGRRTALPALQRSYFSIKCVP